MLSILSLNIPSLFLRVSESRDSFNTNFIQDYLKITSDFRNANIKSSFDIKNQKFILLYDDKKIIYKNKNGRFTRGVVDKMNGNTILEHININRIDIDECHSKRTLRSKRCTFWSEKETRSRFINRYWWKVNVVSKSGTSSFILRGR
jgi:hypothetical protein